MGMGSGDQPGYDEYTPSLYDATRAAVDLSRAGWPISEIAAQLSVTQDAVARWVVRDRRRRGVPSRTLGGLVATNEPEQPQTTQEHLRDIYTALTAVVQALANHHVDMIDLRRSISELTRVSSGKPAVAPPPLDMTIGRMIVHILGTAWPETLNVKAVTERLWIREDFRVRYSSFGTAEESVRATVSHLYGFSQIERVGRGEYRAQPDENTGEEEAAL